MEKQTAVEELKDLLGQWELLLTDRYATFEQYTQLSTKIANLCAKLDSLEKQS